MFDNQEELKAHIEHVKRCLQFYAQSVEELLKQENRHKKSPGSSKFPGLSCIFAYQ